MNSTQYSIFVYSKLVVKWLNGKSMKDFLQFCSHIMIDFSYNVWRLFSNSSTPKVLWNFEKSSNMAIFFLPLKRISGIHCNTIKHKGTFRGPNVCKQPAANTSYFTNFIKEILLRTVCLHTIMSDEACSYGT